MLKKKQELTYIVSIYEILTFNSITEVLDTSGLLYFLSYSPTK